MYLFFFQDTYASELVHQRTRSNNGGAYGSLNHQIPSTSYATTPSSCPTLEAATSRTRKYSHEYFMTQYDYVSLKNSGCSYPLPIHAQPPMPANVDIYPTLTGTARSASEQMLRGGMNSASYASNPMEMPIDYSMKNRTSPKSAQLERCEDELPEIDGNLMTSSLFSACSPLRRYFVQTRSISTADSQSISPLASTSQQEDPSLSVPEPIMTRQRKRRLLLLDTFPKSGNSESPTRSSRRSRPTKRARLHYFLPDTE